MKRMVRLIPILLFLICSCEKENIDFGFEKFTIKAGHHYSRERGMNFALGETFSFSAMFNETAMYVSDTLINQQDVNKLYGFSDHTIDNHENSARFGWRWYQNQIQIFAYTYADGVREMKQVGVAEISEANDYEIRATDTSYLFTFKGEVISMKRGHISSGPCVTLFPYFGGNETAPHDIEIYLKK